MVRVAAVKRAVEEGDAAPDLAGLTPREQLAAIRAARRTRSSPRSIALVNDDAAAGARRRTASASLDRRGARRRRGAPRSATFFRDAVLPVLTPLAIDVSRPFPLLSSLSLNLALLLEPAPGESGRRLAIVQVPAGLTAAGVGGRRRRLHVRPARGRHPGAHRRSCFPARRSSRPRSSGWPAMPSSSSTTRAAARTSRWSSAKSAAGAAATSSGSRSRPSASEELLALLREQLESRPDEVYAVPGPLDLRVLLGLAELPGFDALRDPPLQPASVLGEHEQTDLFAVLDERDVLLHHPYDAYDPVVALRRAGGRRSRRARDQADALSHQRRARRSSPACSGRPSATSRSPCWSS